MKLLIVLIANKSFDLASIEIRVAFLQGRGLDCKVFFEPTRDVKIEGNI